VQQIHDVALDSFVIRHHDLSKRSVGPCDPEAVFKQGHIRPHFGRLEELITPVGSYELLEKITVQPG
jgi:hypothetical protein